MKTQDTAELTREQHKSSTRSPCACLTFSQRSLPLFEKATSIATNTIVKKPRLFGHNYDYWHGLL